MTSLSDLHGKTTTQRLQRWQEFPKWEYAQVIVWVGNNSLAMLSNPRTPRLQHEGKCGPTDLASDVNECNGVDKYEGCVKGKLLLSGVVTPRSGPEIRVRTKAPDITL